MKNAKELLLEFTAFSFKGPEKAAAMFSKDGAFEMPHLTTFGGSRGAIRDVRRLLASSDSCGNSILAFSLRTSKSL